MPATLGFLGLSRLTKPLTLEEGLRILERDRYRCQYCGLEGMASFENSLVMSVDFITPRARKGKKDPANLVTACYPGPHDASSPAASTTLASPKSSTFTPAAVTRTLPASDRDE